MVQPLGQTLQAARFSLDSPQKDSKEKYLLPGRRIANGMRGETPTWKASAMPAVGIAADGIHIARSLAGKLIKGISPDGRFLNQLGLFSGSIWVALGLNEIKSGVQDYSQAKSIGDGEGNKRAQGRLLSGAILTNGALVYLAGKSIELGLENPGLGNLLGSVADVIFGVGSVVGMGISGLGLVRCHRFRSRLIAKLENKEIPTEALRCFNALEYLKNTMIVTEEERDKITKEVDLLDLSSDEKGALVEKKLIDRAEAKMKYLKRRTSQKALVMILNRVESALSKLSDPLLEAQGIVEARALIEDVKAENRKKSRLHAVAFLAAAIGFAALIASFVLSGGIVPCAMYAVSSSIFLFMSLYAMYQQRKEKQPEFIPVEPQSL